LIRGYAEFVDARTLRVGSQIVRTRATVIATGARSFVPPEWRVWGDGILTAESLFQQESLPRSVAVLGLGAIGIEFAQVFHRLGVTVIGIEKGARVAGIDDPAVNATTVDIIGRDIPLWLGADVSIDRRDGSFQLRAGGREAQVEKLFVAVGRRPNVYGLSFNRLGIETNELGVPGYNPRTMQVGRLPIYIAGDATGAPATLQRAADGGRIAGYNAARGSAAEFKPKTDMSIVFCDPNVASVGARWSELDPDATAVGEADFKPLGRAVIAGRNRGALRIYATREGGQILGAAMVGPRCEHLAHPIAWAVEMGMTVTEALRMPYYHPVFEEAIQEALQHLHGQLHGADSPMPQFRGLGNPVAPAA
jgi:dihydrolipoamide dehydrogenase